MPDMRQGDILRTAKEEGFELAVVFGHVGYNFMRATWDEFSADIPEWQALSDPFSELSGAVDPYRMYQQGQWMRFVKSYEYYGVSDDSIRDVVETAINWAHELGLKRIITNGAGPTGHLPNSAHNAAINDERTDFLVQLITPLEARFGVRVTLMSLNEVFVRRTLGYGV